MRTWYCDSNITDGEGTMHFYGDLGNRGKPWVTRTATQKLQQDGYKSFVREVTLRESGGFTAHISRK